MGGIGCVRRCAEKCISDIGEGRVVATQPVPPEAALIKERRLNRIPKMGAPAAAAAATAAGAKTSPAGWRSIENGRCDAPEGKLATMAPGAGGAARAAAEDGA